MKKNMFGELILQKEDDIAAHFAETYNTEGPFQANDVGDDPNFGWTALILDEELNEVQAHDFDNRSQLTEWLTGQGVEIQ